MPECGNCCKLANGGMFPLCDECAMSMLQKLAQGQVYIEGQFTPPCDCLLCRRRRAARSN